MVQKKAGKGREKKEEKPFQTETKRELVRFCRCCILLFLIRTAEKFWMTFLLLAERGQIIGITGPVACGKSTLGKAFLCEYPYEGQILYHGRELQDAAQAERIGWISYLGHDPELFADSIAENVLLGDSGDPVTYLQLVRLDQEAAEMSEGVQTRVGSGGVRLSGGQAQRLALARTLCHKKTLLILDDPFSALDRKTEREIFSNLKKVAKDNVVLLFSHRLYLFPELDQVIWMENGKAITGSHTELMEKVPEYAELIRAEEGERKDEA